MAVTRFGGTMEFAARHFHEKHGLEPGKDIVLIQIGSSADVVPAMTNGLVQSEVMSVPYLSSSRAAWVFVNWRTCQKREFATPKRR
jgi:ABC-type nitrate/sulfonate/bicarbonate transport system substrate-binding protein